jgi:hypothetical protein
MAVQVSMMIYPVGDSQLRQMTKTSNARAMLYEVEVKLRLTISQPVSLGVGLTIFVFSLTIAGFLLWGALSDERMGL